MSKYAATTDVSPEQSRNEIEKVLKRYGATAYMFGWDNDRGMNMISFRLDGRLMRIQVRIPTLEDPRFDIDSRGYRNNEDRRKAAFEQGVKQRWRAMLLYVKAACEAIENDMLTVDEAFMANVVLPNNQTMAEWAGPQIVQMIDGGKMPPLLPGA